MNPVYKKRIDYLFDCAELDHIAINEKSKNDFLDTMGKMPFYKEVKLFLLENGNFRLTIAKKDGTALSMQFLGNEIVQLISLNLEKPESGKYYIQ